MQITHEEAHKLIQLNTDDALNPQEITKLFTHLQECIECQGYADEIKEVESILLPIMKRQWNLQPPPFSSATVQIKSNSKIQTSIILATRMAAISAVFLGFIFSVWQFTMSGGGESTPLPVSVLPVPTPLTQSTNTKITRPNCTEALYIVQENDTLESIAYQFATSREELMAVNHMETATVRTDMELIVPVCNLTPTGTIRPTILATTYTPSIRPATFTPDG